MRFETINSQLFEEINQEEMMQIQGGTKGTTNLTCIHTTCPCNCMDADDCDTDTSSL
jgi:bacteriocin-like protein